MKHNRKDRDGVSHDDCINMIWLQITWEGIDGNEDSCKIIYIYGLCVLRGMSISLLKIIDYSKTVAREEIVLWVVGYNLLYNKECKSHYSFSLAGYCVIFLTSPTSHSSSL